MRDVIKLFSIVIFSFLLSLPASARKPSPPNISSSISCANIRCAGGCVDTPDGPICTDQRPTCASTLCEQGNICVEKPSGPVCVPQDQPYNPIHPYNPPNHQPPSYGHIHSDSCYHRPPQLIYIPTPRPSYTAAPWNPWTNNWTNNWTPWRNHWSPVRPIPQPVPRPIIIPAPRPWTPWPTQPAPKPTPQPEEPRFCPMVYDPVCAEKIVQCVTTPCPPIRKTFGNSCEASVEDYTVIHEGQCQ